MVFSWFKEHIAKHMYKEHEMKPKDCRKELDNAVADGLIEKFEDPRTNEEAFRIPEEVEVCIVLAQKGRCSV